MKTSKYEVSQEILQKKNWKIRTKIKNYKSWWKAQKFCNFSVSSKKNGENLISSYFSSKYQKCYENILIVNI